MQHAASLKLLRFTLRSTLRTADPASLLGWGLRRAVRLTAACLLGMTRLREACNHFLSTRLAPFYARISFLAPSLYHLPEILWEAAWWAWLLCIHATFRLETG